jgi:hypothetical protein
MRNVSSLGMSILFYPRSFFAHSTPGFLDVGLHLTELRPYFVFSSTAIIANFINLSLLLYHKLLPN